MAGTDLFNVSDELTIYYGAADEFVCGAKFSIAEILQLLN